MSPQKYPPVKLPHPFLTSYQVKCNEDVTPAKFVLTLDKQPANTTALPQALHSDDLTWRDLTSRPADKCPPGSDNGAWARAYRSPQTTFAWSSQETPNLGQIWNVVHAIYLAHPTIEYFRLALEGSGREVVRQELLATGLAIEHPKPWREVQDTGISDGDILVLRSAFWQGAASPVGPRPIWAVGNGTQGPVRKPISEYPTMPEHQQFTMKFPEQPIYTLHPTRQPKPHPGSICYSRYIPELNEHFSLEVIDWQSAEHVKLFNTWQNDPRVAQGWNETGTIDQHREYLRKLHFDPHVLCLFGRFDDTRFSYYELYWAKVSRTPNPTQPMKTPTNPHTGGSLRRALQSQRLRPRPALARRRRILPRLPPRQRVVLQLHPLLLPGRRAHGECRRRAQSHGRHHPVIRELGGLDDRQVCGFGPQALGAFGLQSGEVVPAVSVVLGWEGESAGVGGSGGVECEALGGG
jgi:hypothetical protein